MQVVTTKVSKNHEKNIIGALEILQAGRWISLANFLLELAMFEPEVQAQSRSSSHESLVNRPGLPGDFLIKG